MTQQHTIAMMIYRASATGRDPVRESDLTKLRELHPELSEVFEELQYLRTENERLQEDVWDKSQELCRLQDQLENE